MFCLKYNRKVLGLCILTCLCLGGYFCWLAWDGYLPVQYVKYYEDDDLNGTGYRTRTLKYPKNGHILEEGNRIRDQFGEWIPRGYFIKYYYDGKKSGRILTDISKDISAIGRGTMKTETINEIINIIMKKWIRCRHAQ